ncbi:MAG: hypothetical protein JNK78_16365 [Planctomycetes bacterium]|nr:hypothetical protein [Planctomycetota bacterium]
MAVSPVRALLVLSTLSALTAPIAAQKGGAKPAPAPVPAAGPPGYAEALARYKECIARIPFVHHTEGRSRLAQTRAMEGLPILISDYTKPKAHPEYSKYTLATLYGRHFDFGEATESLNALRIAQDKPIDTWLWVQTLRIVANRSREAEVIDIATGDKNLYHRAAAIAAIGESRSGDVKAVVLPNCLEFPKKESDRALLLGAMTGALWEQKSRVNDAAYREALTAYIGLLADDVGLSHTLKVQMGRHLQWILNGPALFVNPEPWLELLARGEVRKPTDNGTTASPRFFGIETDGERICYVVDMSDSMLMAISPSAKPPTNPITGPRPKKKRALLDESDLPWDKIQTRWDLAREQLRISLLRLTPDKTFSVVWFGDSSGTLEACKGMMKATKSNVDRAIAELDSIKPAPVPPPVPGENNRGRTGVVPPGEKEPKVLRGDTNMHSGIARAFGLAGKGFVATAAYVDEDALTEGCDTIFMLSDGAPTSDDFIAVDKDYHEGEVVSDMETSKAAPRTPQIWYPGPYREDGWLIEDVRRMNAFRRIRMHCIGLGEANEGLLKRLAEVGHGEVFFFGQKKDGK